MEMGILDGFKGYAVHDCWASYFRFAILHVLCGAHFLRELIHAHEQHQQMLGLEVDHLPAGRQEGDR
ncbi:hypothetical protein IMCC3135_04510 [Granulosicoccus antarcticus IMCC3135]|uniref:Transposase IS66 central domain-containing protein n=2 Tax=Granulosicoccus TaxID=437504 RepID=A0A2Z2NKH3_9GAMM|nr:hypothetical protein IMCC3135_04510 [Granulosicoccus antarcticus IMCC3135]